MIIFNLFNPMAFDPTKPVEGSEIDATELRAQLTGLDDKITAIGSVTGAQVDTTNTGPPGSSAGASVSLSGGVLHFNFDVPQGVDGLQGPPGEVTQSQLSNDLVNTQNAAVNTALGLSSANSNGVSLLSGTVSNPPTQAEVQENRDRLNELINALRR